MTVLDDVVYVVLRELEGAPHGEHLPLNRDGSGALSAVGSRNMRIRRDTSG